MELLTSATAIGAGSTVDLRGGRIKTLQASGTTSSGSGAATVNIEVRNGASHAWLVAGTITLTLGTTVAGDGFVMDAPWAQVRANLTAISGTGAAVTVSMGG